MTYNSKNYGYILLSLMDLRTKIREFATPSLRIYNDRTGTVRLTIKPLLIIYPLHNGWQKRENSRSIIPL